MLKEIKTVSEVTKELSVLYIYSESCGHCKKVDSEFNAFVQAHPDLAVCKIEQYEKSVNAAGKEVLKVKSDVFPLSLGGTPTFVFFKDGKPYNRIKGSDTTVDQLSRALVELGDVAGTDFHDVMKTTLLYAYSDSCGDCEETKKSLSEFESKNPFRRVAAIAVSQELKNELKITQQVALPILAIYIKGKPALGKYLYGKKTAKEIQEWADKVEREGIGSCGSNPQPQNNIVTAEVNHLKALLAEKDKRIAFLEKLVERIVK